MLISGWNIIVYSEYISIVFQNENIKTRFSALQDFYVITHFPLLFRTLYLISPIQSLPIAKSQNRQCIDHWPHLSLILLCLLKALKELAEDTTHHLWRSLAITIIIHPRRRIHQPRRKQVIANDLSYRERTSWIRSTVISKLMSIIWIEMMMKLKLMKLVRSHPPRSMLVRQIKEEVNPRAIVNFLHHQELKEGHHLRHM